MSGFNKAQTFLSGLVFGESPRWHDRFLWLADWGAKEVVNVDLNDTRKTILQVSFHSYPMSIDFLPDGSLLVMSSSDGLLKRREPDGTLVTYADLSNFNYHSWNEVVVDGRGNIYVNCVAFDFMKTEKFVPGIIVLITPNGEIRKVADGLAFPNGMAITPDNSTLIVAESYGNKLSSFKISANGDLSERKVWAEIGNDHPDGICLDAEGAIWYADVGNKHCVRVEEGGKVLQTVEVDRRCFACILGGNDRTILFIIATEWETSNNTSRNSRTSRVLAVKAPARGVGWP